jgi:dolichol-phosphate mannosyltransferase
MNDKMILKSVVSKPVDSVARIAVVIPCYRVIRHIISVIDGIGPEVERIYVVDDCCPDGSGDFVERECKDVRVKVLRNETNQGVGGAVMHGYSEAVKDGIDIIVKIDGDGQMDARMLPRLIRPILEGRADYTKGNRFYDLSRIGQMPPMRLFGNAVLSFMAKLSTGYWGMFDPANGYTAISTKVAAHLPMDKISRRYFFETDMLFRLNTLRAVVLDMPMHAFYGDEVSHLKITKILPEFLVKHGRNFFKRIFYNYFLRDMSIASFELLFGLVLSVFGSVYGIYHWILALQGGTATPLGIIMIATLPTLVGLQLLLAFFAYDISSVPQRSVAQDLPDPIPDSTY